MSYGNQSYGIGSWGGSDFYLINQVPADTSTGISRLPTISFSLISEGGDINISSINVTANLIPLIVNGVFQTTVSGTINIISASNLQIVMQVTHAYQPLSIVAIVVTALNVNDTPLSSGGNWQFTVDNEIFTFTNYVMRGYQRIANAGG